MRTTLLLAVMRRNSEIILSALFLLLTLLVSCSGQPDGASCENGGTLYSDKCLCAEQYEGDRCEVTLCYNLGRPIARLEDGKVRCSCPFGWLGDQCQEPELCYHGGTKAGGVCLCPDGFYGERCLRRQCRRGLETENGTCDCELGFVGPYCSEVLNCNYGNVSGEENRCECPEGFQPPDCRRCLPHLVFVPHDVFGGECVLVPIEKDVEQSTFATVATIVAQGSIWVFDWRWWLLLFGCILPLLCILIAIGYIVWRKVTKSKRRVADGDEGDENGTVANGNGHNGTTDSREYMNGGGTTLGNGVEA